MNTILDGSAAAVAEDSTWNFSSSYRVSGNAWGAAGLRTPARILSEPRLFIIHAKFSNCVCLAPRTCRRKVCGDAVQGLSRILQFLRRRELTESTWNIRELKFPSTKYAREYISSNILFSTIEKYSKLIYSIQYRLFRILFRKQNQSFETSRNFHSFNILSKTFPVDHLRCISFS